MFRETIVYKDTDSMELQFTISNEGCESFELWKILSVQLRQDADVNLVLVEDILNTFGFVTNPTDITAYDVELTCFNLTITISPI